MATRTFRIRRRWITAAEVVAFELVADDALPLAAAEPGAHVEVSLSRPGLPPLLRHYSLCNRPGETGAYVLGIKREADSRGGSAHLHTLEEGATLELGTVRNHFPLSAQAQSHLLLAGGIGITPLLAMAQALEARRAEYRLHYFVRSIDHVAFSERLAPLAEQGRVQVHAGLAPAQTSAQVAALLAERGTGQHAYCCGPEVFMQLVEELGRARWPAECLHFERFQAAAGPADGGTAAFRVELARSGLSCTVLPGQSIAQALAAAGCEVEVSCEQGVCGTCLTRVLAGVPDHRDVYLNAAERARGDQLLPCVSRALSPVLVLDR